MQPSIRKFLLKLSESTIINKAKLFLKPFELMDGIGRLSLEGPKKDKKRDVVSKGVLSKLGNRLTCLRCSGQTEVGANTAGGPVSAWSGWEQKWVNRCVCGGYWVKHSQPSQSYVA